MPDVHVAWRKSNDVARRFAAALLVVALASCATIELTDVERTPSFAHPTPTATRLGKAVYAEAAKHPGQSAFRLVQSGLAGFAARIALIDAAEHTVDLQYFLMEGETADLVAERLLAAADRDVRVRVLLDDRGQHGREGALAALSSHRGIEVRVFNPVLMRGPATALSAFEYLVRGLQLDRRMHNKLFVADNSIAMIGGRNIGDAYFEAPGDIDFQDLDVVAAGPIVRTLSSSFDDYWNSSYAVPIEALVARPGSHEIAAARAELAALRDGNRDTAYARAVRESHIARDVADGKFRAIWARARVLADSPRKVDPLRDDGARRIADELVPAIASVQRELVIVSPYVIPDDASLSALRAVASRGARVRILTNSLATNDMPLAHAGYAAMRGSVLDAGVDLYELKPQALPFKGAAGSHGPSSGSRTSLHVKALVFDRRYVFLTSMNLDPRSIHLNTEIGLWIDSTALAAEVLRRVDEAVKPDNSFHVVRAADGSVQWITARDGAERRYDDEPETTAAQRLRARLAQLLPIKKEL
jgi:putative cardiolipin synthase